MRIAKISAMGMSAVAAWSGNWLLLRQSIYQDEPLGYFGWLSLLVIGAIVFLTFFFLINRNKIASLLVDSAIFGAYLAIMPKEFYVVLGGVVFLIFLLLFEARIRNETKNTVDFSLRRIMSGSVSLILYSLLIAIGFNIYSDSLLDFRANPDAYYERLNMAATRAVPYVEQSFPDIPAIEREQLARQVAEQTVGRIKLAAAGYEQYFPLIFAIIITGLLWTFAFLIRWASIIVGWVIFKLLLWLGFFKLQPQTVDVQILQI